LARASTCTCAISFEASVDSIQQFFSVGSSRLFQRGDSQSKDSTNFVLASSELELDLKQTQMAKKPMLREKVYAHALRASQNVKRA
jgi:hypothetical protein